MIISGVSCEFVSVGRVKGRRSEIDGAAEIVDGGSGDVSHSTVENMLGNLVVSLESYV